MQQKIMQLALIIVFALALTGCSTQPTITPSRPMEEPTHTSTPIAQAIDYVDVQRNPEKYDGDFIRVAGQITNFSSTNNFSFYFNDRLSLYEDGIGFEVEIRHQRNNSNIDELYGVGDYIVVEGTWRVRPYGQSLEEAAVICTGKDAEEAAKVYLSSWENERKDFASSAPILNYMEIFNDKNYDGQYVRIVGQISEAKSNGVTHFRNIRFRNTITNESTIEISLQGCPIEMQANCNEGEYAIISGKIDVRDFSARMSDCYVECIGEDAEKIFYTVMTGWF